MLSASDDLKHLFKQHVSIRSGVSCELEYNMNSLIDGIVVTSATSDTDYTNKITGWPSGKANPYKKLFPVDSIVKAFRPLNPGIKYFIMTSTPNVDTPSNSFSAYRTLQYPNSQPRVYYPGITTYYKYWVSAINTNVDITVTYKQATNPVSGNKHAITNKIVATFEKHHALPTNYTVTITKENGTTESIGPVITPASGKVTLYLSGGSWYYMDGSSHIPYNVVLDSPISIKSIRLQATNPGGGKIVGIIELSARWVKDISNDVTTFSISKESSSSTEDFLPVGQITANSASINLTKYSDVAPVIVPYNRLSTSFDTSLIYTYKNIEIRPYIRIYHSAGAIGSGGNKYDKLIQGTYFANDWSISEYGDASITGLDGSKYLIETLCPDILCEDYPVTAILRRLLDSVGFTNYNFTLAENDTSIPQVLYWWTDDQKSVWEAIQELCKDIQMNAVFDENNVLQFYSRDYMYNQETISWNFYEDKEVVDNEEILPNIISFTQKEIPSSNYVTVYWKAPIATNYTGNSARLWEAPKIYLSAGGLQKSITSSDMELTIDTFTLDPNARQQTFYNYNGYLLINSEIIEYEAIGYDCVLRDGTKQHQWIYSAGDLNKWRNLTKPGFEDALKPETAYFKPSGRYKIKTRGALGTKPAEHLEANAKNSTWSGYEVTW
jgi:hypothetical protein